MIPEQPSLSTARLILRPFKLTDAPDVQKLAGAREVAEMTLLIPHPYGDGMAEKWIQTQAGEWEQRKSAVFAMTRESELLGAIGLRMNLEHAHAEMGYWVGVAHWGHGYATEAAGALLRFALEKLEIWRVFAHHFKRNPASGRVLRKIGMRYEGCFRQHVRRWDQFEDLECYGILREDWLHSS